MFVVKIEFTVCYTRQITALTFFAIYIFTDISIKIRLGNRATLGPLRKFIEYCRIVELSSEPLLFHKQETGKELGFASTVS